MVFKGSYQSYDSKTMASVAATYLPISAKDSREICKAIKGKRLDAAMKYLQAVIKRKQAVPYKRYNWDTPHRRGNMAAGRFPRKASEFILPLLRNLKANAAGKNLDEENLLLVHAAAQRGPVLWHYGRQRGIRRKCTHFEAVAKEIEKKEKPKTEAKKEAKLTEEKKEETKAEEKPKSEKPKEEVKDTSEQAPRAFSKAEGERKVERAKKKTTPKPEKKEEKKK